MTPMADILPLTETVVAPDQESVAAVLRGACQSETPVYPIGGGTSLDYGVRPVRPGIGLSLAGLTEVVDYPARDLTITVQAGITIEALSAHLATQRQRLPVDIPNASQATLGGAVVCNPSGPRRLACGTMRDYVIGFSAVDGRGTCFQGGGRVVKNAAGYDLCRLMIGSLGTLGVITQVTLMVKPMPETTVFVACEVPELDVAERLLAAMIDSKTLPVALELLAGPAWQEDAALGPASGPAVGRLVAGLEGTAAEVEWMAGQLEREWRAAGIDSARTIAGAAAESLWNRLIDFPVAAAPDGPVPLVVRISVLPSVVTRLVDRLIGVDPTCSLQAHAGSGVVRARFVLAPGDVAGCIETELRPAVASVDGHLTVLSCPAEVTLSRQAVWGPVGDGETVMQAIRAKFDPKAILNPGRFVFS